MPSYKIEFAKSGRSSCKKCKEKIAKGELRIGITSPGPAEYDVTVWNHPVCFNIPRAMKSMTPEEFVSDVLEDGSDDGSILPAKADEIAIAIGTKKQQPKKGASGNESGGLAFIAKLKAEFDGDKKRKASPTKVNDIDDDEPATKKKKSSKPTASELYGKYHKQSADVLKDYLRWNRQVLKGTKDVILFKIIDGEMNGRLSLCCMCDGGKLKFNDTCDKVICNGVFDEDRQVKIPCSATYEIEKAPRAHPWFTEEPTEEEKEAMEKAEEKIKSGGGGGDDADEDGDLGKLIKAAEEHTDMAEVWGKDMKKSAKLLLAFLQESEVKVDLPDNTQDVKIALGKILVENRDKSPAEIVKMVASKYGLASAKAKKTAAKEESIKADCANPANAALLCAFIELSDLYFKEGNTNAGVSTKKVAAAIKNLDFEVTGANAKGLGSGKNKVPGVGASSAKKMYEFVTTGTMEKLEEKRQNAA